MNKAIILLTLILSASAFCNEFKSNLKHIPVIMIDSGNELTIRVPMEKDIPEEFIQRDESGSIVRYVFSVQRKKLGRSNGYKTAVRKYYPANSYLQKGINYDEYPFGLIERNGKLDPQFSSCTFALNPGYSESENARRVGHNQIQMEIYTTTVERVGKKGINYYSNGHIIAEGDTYSKKNYQQKNNGSLRRAIKKNSNNNIHFVSCRSPKGYVILDDLNDILDNYEQRASLQLVNIID